MSDIADQLRQRTFSYALRILASCRQVPDTWDAREIGRQLLRAGMGVAGNYWSACRARSDREFVAKLGVAVDEAEESVLWLTVIIQGGIRADSGTKELVGEGAVLSKSHRTAKENRRRGKTRKNQLTNSPIREFTKSI